MSFAASISTAEAANLTLFTNAPTSVPLVITPLDATTPLLVSVLNDASANPPSEYISGWQFRLRIVPDPTAAGTLQFGAVTEPINYVFSGHNHFTPIPSANFVTELAALDSTFPPSDAVKVPIVPGVNLLSISMSPSGDARGTFEIFALDTDTLWSDSTNSPRRFVNVPSGGGPVHIADVLVTSVADYNRNGIVDAADYTIWRDTLGSAVNLAADGNGNQQIDAGDFTVWKMHFGEHAPGAGASAAVPEPGSARIAIVGILTVVTTGGLSRLGCGLARPI